MHQNKAGSIHCQPSMKYTYLDVDKMFSIFNKRKVSIVDTLFFFTCSSRPLTNTPYNLSSDQVKETSDCQMRKYKLKMFL